MIEPKLKNCTDPNCVLCGRSDEMSDTQAELRKDIEHTILAWSSMTTGKQQTKLHPEVDQLVLMLIDLFQNHADKQIEAVLDKVREEQRIWMHEHAELNLGYATYMLSIIDIERKRIGGQTNEKTDKTEAHVYKIDKARLKRLADWHAQPWYKRIFRRFK